MARKDRSGKKHSKVERHLTLTLATAFVAIAGVILTSRFAAAADTVPLPALDRDIMLICLAALFGCGITITRHMWSDAAGVRQDHTRRG